MGITYSAPSPLLVAEGIPTSRAYLEALALAHDKFPGMSRDGLSLMALALSRNLRRLVLHEKHLLASLTSVSDDLCLELGKTLVADDGLLELTVHDRNITTVSSHVDQLVFLQRLDLAHCSLTELPKSVGKLGRRADKKAGGFWSVGLADNRLERLPDTIAGWTKVRVLHLSNNRLVELPEDLAAMTCLEILTVDTNRELKSLPEAFRRLKKLKFVDASNTALEELPISFYTLPSLETLVLECTNIEEIEEMVSGLTSLTTLHIGRNLKLRYLPMSLGRLEALKTIDVVGCRYMRHPPEKLREKRSTAAIKEYLLNVKRPGSSSSPKRSARRGRAAAPVFAKPEFVDKPWHATRHYQITAKERWEATRPRTVMEALFGGTTTLADIES